jgi:hypothetical protein
MHGRKVKTLLLARPQKNKYTPSHSTQALGSMIGVDPPSPRQSTFCHRASTFHLKPLWWKYAGLGPTVPFQISHVTMTVTPFTTHPWSTLSLTGLTTMSSHIKFAEPVQKKGGNGRLTRETREKGSTQRAPSPGSEIVYPTGWRLVLTTIGYLCPAKCPKAVNYESLPFW